MLSSMMRAVPMLSSFDLSSGRIAETSSSASSGMPRLPVALHPQLHPCTVGPLRPAAEAPGFPVRM